VGGAAGACLKVTSNDHIWTPLSMFRTRSLKSLSLGGLSQQFRFFSGRPAAAWRDGTAQEGERLERTRKGKKKLLPTLAGNYNLAGDPSEISGTKPARVDKGPGEMYRASGTVPAASHSKTCRPPEAGWDRHPPRRGVGRKERGSSRARLDLARVGDSETHTQGSCSEDTGSTGGSKRGGTDPLEESFDLQRRQSTYKGNAFLAAIQ